jgi:hypothetical protein
MSLAVEESGSVFGQAEPIISQRDSGDRDNQVLHYTRYCNSTRPCTDTRLPAGHKKERCNTK